MSRFAAAELGLPDAVPCPFCDGSDTELHSAFGGQLSVATYWCRRCGTAFEWFKHESAAPDGRPFPATGASGCDGARRHGLEHAETAQKVVDVRTNVLKNCWNSGGSAEAQETVPAP